MSAVSPGAAMRWSIHFWLINLISFRRRQWFLFFRGLILSSVYVSSQKNFCELVDLYLVVVPHPMAHLRCFMLRSEKFGVRCRIWLWCIMGVCPWKWEQLFIGASIMLENVSSAVREVSSAKCAGREKCCTPLTPKQIIRYGLESTELHPPELGLLRMWWVFWLALSELGKWMVLKWSAEEQKPMVGKKVFWCIGNFSPSLSGGPAAKHLTEIDLWKSGKGNGGSVVKSYSFWFPSEV